MFIKCNVVMLPTKEKAHLGSIYRRISHKIVPKLDTNDEVGKLFVNQNKNLFQSNNDFTAHHLYITSDDAILGGDWFLNTTYHTIHKCHSVSENIQSDLNGRVYHGKFECKKIIATTDRSLMKESALAGEMISLPLPAIPSEFINTYVNEYNKDNEITSALVLYDYTRINAEYFQYPLLMDNTIDIKLIVKDEYTRKEVAGFIHLALAEFNNQYNEQLEMIDNWINKHL